MAFRIKSGKPIRRELKRVARQQLKRARGHLELRAGSHVHDARRSVKKVRAIVMLLGEAETTGLRKDARRLRAVGRTLSKLRDAGVVLDTMGRVSRAVGSRVPEHTLSAFRRDFTRARAQAVAAAIDDGSVARAAGQLRAVRRSAADWEVPAIEPIDLPGLVKVAYRTARKAMRRAERTCRASDLHEWRKGVKTLWYELRLIAEWAPSLAQTIKGLNRLETLLGEHHDLFVLKAAIAQAGPPEAVVARNALTHVATSQQDAAQRKAFALGRRMLADRPRGFERALREALSHSASRDQPHADQRASAAA